MAHVRLFKHYIHIPYLVLGLLEGVIFVASLYGAAYLRFFQDPSALDQLGSLMPRAVCFSLVMLVSMVSMGVYQAQLREGLSGVMLRTAVSFFLGATALSVIFYLFPSLFMGRGVVALSAFFSFVLVGTVRYLFMRKVNNDRLKRKILVLGAGVRAKNILDRLGGPARHKNFQVMGFIPVNDECTQIESSLFIHPSGSLYDFVHTEEVDEIVVAMDDRRQRFPMGDLLDCKLSGVDVVDELTFFERETGRVIVESVHPSWLVFSDGFSQNSVKELISRGLDIFASGSLLLIAWPFMLATAIAIKIEGKGRGDIFYRQQRVGLDGKSFWVYKFRSMRADAEKGGAQWAQENDDRITKVGRFIRQYRIDELPQIINVFKGDMSFVGPRPERPEFVSSFSEKVPYYSERHRVKPGITGWAQLCYPYGASEDDAIYKLEYDMYYVKNRSLLLDILILIQTVEVILFGKGAR